MFRGMKMSRHFLDFRDHERTRQLDQQKLLPVLQNFLPHRVLCPWDFLLRFLDLCLFELRTDPTEEENIQGYMTLLYKENIKGAYTM